MSDFLLVFTLILLGFLFLAFELLIIPGFGFMGILGLGSLGIASYLSYVRLNPVAGAAVTIVSIVAIIIAVKMFPKTRMWRRMRLEKTTAGYSGTKDGLKSLLGKQGITVTPLRPVGTALIEGRRVDVIAEIGLINGKKQIVVVNVEGNKVIVKEVK